MSKRKLQHDEGPWTIDQTKSESGAVFTRVLCDGGDGVVCEMDFLRENDKENAQLIAAAPDMLKALDALAAATAQELGIDWKQSSLGIRTYAALAKAKGETK